MLSCLLDVDYEIVRFHSNVGSINFYFVNLFVLLDSCDIIVNLKLS